MKTVLITGCSSGYGLQTALHFYGQGWNVIATMRTPRTDLLPTSERLRVLPLDVTKAESIASALDAAGPIDLLVKLMIAVIASFGLQFVVLRRWRDEMIGQVDRAVTRRKAERAKLRSALAGEEDGEV